MDRGQAESAGTPEPGVPAGEATLSALVARSARGDREAFADLYDAMSRRVYGLVLRVVRDPAQAEEVTQEAFLQVWRTASRYDADRGSALSWVLTIAHGKAVDRVRASESSTRRDTTYHHHTQPVDHDTTADAVHASLDARRVRSALAGLTQTQREAIELAYFGGYTHTEVAALLGLPLGTAKTRIRDGLIRLRDTIGVDR